MRISASKNGIVLTQFVIVINTLPPFQPDQFLAQRCQLCGLIVRLLPVAGGVDGKATGRGAIAPRVDALLA